MIETIVGIFIPPACREEVLGDLRERNDGVQLFIYDALRTARPYKAALSHDQAAATMRAEAEADSGMKSWSRNSSAC